MFIPLLLFAAAPLPQPEPPPQGAPITSSVRNAQVSVSASPMKRAVKPGGEQLIALAFTIAEGWHIYWDGQNDTGQPPTVVSSRLPAGFTLGAIRWPVPRRHVSPGDILDYIYEGRVSVFVPVRVPDTAKSGEKVRVELDLTWLQCERVCIPGKGSVAVEFLVSDTPGNFPDPMPVPEDPRYRSLWRVPKLLTPDGPFKADFDGTTLRVKASRAGELEFLPAADGATVADLLHTGVTKDDTLTLTLKPEGAATHAKGILRLQPAKKSDNADAEEEIVAWIDLAPPAKPAGAGAPAESTSPEPPSR